MVEHRQPDIFKCPFCGHEGIAAVPGKTICQKCAALFEIDDRADCVIVDPMTPRLPMDGTFSPACGLVQETEAGNCVFCKARLYGAIQ